jgi:rare lipoprotein A
MGEEKNSLHVPGSEVERNTVKRSTPAGTALAVLLFLAAAGLSAFEAEEGLASWYGGKFQGRRTASGELFDTFRLTAAHRTLPFGTLVLVTNLENGKSTTVRINDRGPFVPGRIIDLSMVAATAIGLSGRGVAPVRIEPVPRAGSAPVQAGTPAPGPARAPPIGSYCLQLGSFRVQANAEQLLARLQAAGFAGASVEASGGLHRVLIRSLEAPELERLQERLAASGFAEVLVRAEP